MDADVWPPERFLEGVESNEKTGLGVFSNVYEGIPSVRQGVLMFFQGRI
jgi:hypothetical protein